MLVYRIARKSFVRDLSGEGARLYGGRWNPKGIGLVYASVSRALAVLEYYVHVDPGFLPIDLALASILIPDNASKKEVRIEDLPRDWRRYPAPVELAGVGGDWAKARESLLLFVPSVVVPREPNVLLNSSHPGMSDVSVVDIEDYFFDARFSRHR
jgi:RES domain-containing protein